MPSIKYAIHNLFLFLLLGLTLSDFCNAQGYEHWLQLSKTQSYFKGSSHLKQIYISETGTKKSLRLRQQKEFGKAMRLLSETSYDPQGRELYSLKFSYPDSSTISILNTADSTDSEYGLNEEGRILYYSSNSTQNYISYSYDSLGRLLTCKDCLVPLEHGASCAYYKYTYQKDRLLLVEEFTTTKKPSKAPPKPYYTDSLIYNAEGQLIGRKIISEQIGKAIAAVTYEYNNKGLMVKYLHQSPSLQSDNMERNIKEHKYWKKGKLKQSVQQGFDGDKLLYRLEIKYDQSGRKRKEIQYNPKGEALRLTITKYKNLPH